MAYGMRGKLLAVVAGGGSAMGQRVCARLARDGNFVWDERFCAALSVVAPIEQDGSDADAIQVEVGEAEAIGRAAALPQHRCRSNSLLRQRASTHCRPSSKTQALVSS